MPRTLYFRTNVWRNRILRDYILISTNEYVYMYILSAIRHIKRHINETSMVSVLLLVTEFLRITVSSTKDIRRKAFVEYICEATCIIQSAAHPAIFFAATLFLKHEEVHLRSAASLGVFARLCHIYSSLTVSPLPFPPSPPRLTPLAPRDNAKIYIWKIPPCSPHN